MKFLFTFSLLLLECGWKTVHKNKSEKQSLKSGNHFYTHLGKRCDEFLAWAFENDFLCLREPNETLREASKSECLELRIA